MARLQLAIEQITFARNYTTRILDSLNPEEWFVQIPGGVTHIAWQVGHLAFAEYRMALERIRGARPQDAELITQDFLKIFGKNSMPSAAPDDYPSPREIREVFDRVHQQTLSELAGMEEAELDALVERPHSLIKTKLWALIWCAQHEAVHAGQIALIRRQLGHPPIW